MYNVDRCLCFVFTTKLLAMIYISVKDFITTNSHLNARNDVATKRTLTINATLIYYSVEKVWPLAVAKQTTAKEKIVHVEMEQ